MEADLGSDKEQKVTWDSVVQVSWKGRKAPRWYRMLLPWLGEKKAQHNDPTVFLYTNNVLLYLYPQSEKRVYAAYQAQTLLWRNLRSCFSCEFKNNMKLWSVL